MKRVIESSRPAESKDFILQSRDQIISKLDEVRELMHELCMSTGGSLQRRFSSAYDKVEDLENFIDNVVDTFYEVQSTTSIKAAEDSLPKGYYDDYFGQTAFEEYGDLVSKECAGMVISKRADEGEEPGGLVYEAERLGIDDFFDLLKCLEGMCYNGDAVEISDYQYKVL